MSQDCRTPATERAERVNDGRSFADGTIAFLPTADIVADLLILPQNS